MAVRPPRYPSRVTQTQSFVGPAGRKIEPRMIRPFEVVSDFVPAGDQPQAIELLSEGMHRGERFQTLLGITGSGKSATMAWTIEQVQRPTLVLAPNKSLAAQLANEFREFFPHNRVEYFVSYYDYYQPEAYMPSSDTFIEKDASVNDEIERLRHAATSALLTRRDVIVVASVSAIYGLGSPEEYSSRLFHVRLGDQVDQRTLLRQLVEIQYERNDMNLTRGKFRVKGDVIEVHPAYDETAVRIELFGDDVDAITVVDPLTGERVAELEEILVFPNTHYATSDESLAAAIVRIEEELQHRLALFEKEGKLLEAQRLRMRTEYDLEMMQEMGFCNGIENYSAHIDGRDPGVAPNTLLNFFPRDYLTIIDESHVTIPQLHGQYEGDRSRKQTLIEHGFRLPSAADNRPLRFEEWVERVGQTIFLSATPGAWEIDHSTQVVEQIIRPTGLIDPEVVIKPTKGQIDDLMAMINERVVAGERVLVTTLTKKMSEDLTDYLLEMGVRVRYLHSEVDTLQRIELVRDLRLGEFDVLVGINLLREGLDIPEVSLVAILDADKEGFLRSETSLIQTTGRAGTKCERSGGDVRRQGHGLDAAGDLGDEPPSAAPGGVQRGERHPPADDPEGGDRHPGRPAWAGWRDAHPGWRASQAAAGREGPGRAVQGPPPVRPRRTDPVARGGDAPGVGGPPIRGGGSFARRGEGAQTGAPVAL